MKNCLIEKRNAGFEIWMFFFFNFFFNKRTGGIFGGQQKVSNRDNCAFFDKSKF